MSGIRLVIALAAAGVSGACGRQSAGSTQADTDAIKRVNQEWTAAIKAGNVEGMMAPLTSGVVLLPPNEPAASGPEAVRAWSQRMADQVAFTEATSVLDEVEFAGDWAFTRGTFHGTFQPKAGGASASDVTKYILLWRRQPDGSWKIARDIWNSNNPVPAR